MLVTTIVNLGWSPTTYCGSLVMPFTASVESGQSSPSCRIGGGTTAAVGVAGGAASGESVDERAAIETVQTYDSAWRDGDCDAYVASTTEYFRDYLGSQLPS